MFDADAGQLVYLGDLMRRWDAPWIGIRANELPQLLSRSEDSPLALRALVAHPSGYVREDALRELVRRDERDLLRFLLFRANDWVDEITRFVSAELAGRMGLAELGALADAFPLILALTRQHRRDHGEIVDQARVRLLSDAGEALTRDSQKWPIVVRRAAFAWVLPSVDDPGSNVLDRRSVGIRPLRGSEIASIASPHARAGRRRPAPTRMLRVPGPR